MASSEEGEREGRVIGKGREVRDKERYRKGKAASALYPVKGRQCGRQCESQCRLWKAVWKAVWKVVWRAVWTLEG